MSSKITCRDLKCSCSSVCLCVGGGEGRKKGEGEGWGGEGRIFEGSNCAVKKIDTQLVYLHINPFNSTSKPSLPSQKNKQTKQKLKKNEGEVKINISRKLKHRRGYAKEKIPVWQI